MNLHTVMVTYNRLDLTKRAVDVLPGNRQRTVLSHRGRQRVHGRNDRVAGRRSARADQNRSFSERTSIPATPPTAAGNSPRTTPCCCTGQTTTSCSSPAGKPTSGCMFSANPNLGQLGLRTDEEELHNTHNVGGNCVIRKELWDARAPLRRTAVAADREEGARLHRGLVPVTQGPEDGLGVGPGAAAVHPVDLDGGSEDDPYYQQTWRDRGIR